VLAAGLGVCFQVDGMDTNLLNVALAAIVSFVFERVLP